MSNFRTMVKRIATKVQRGNLGDEIRLSIIDAIEYLKSEESNFNEGEFEFTTTDGVGLYKFQEVITDSSGFFISDQGGKLFVTSGGSKALGYVKSLPHDWIEPIGSLYFLVGGDINTCIELQPEGYRSGDIARYDAGDSSTYPHTAYWAPEGLRLVPDVQGSTHVVKTRYKKRVWRPTASWNGSSWTFDSDYVNSDWFRNNKISKQVMLKAIQILYEEHIRDYEAAAVSEGRYRDLINDRREEVSRIKSTGKITPWGFC